MGFDEENQDNQFDEDNPEEGYDEEPEGEDI